jgi:hypothetical protein
MGHLDHGTKSRFAKTPREWLGVGSQINDLVNGWAGRDDIVTFIGEGAGHSAPACFIPAIAEMEVNVEMAFGEKVDPRFIGDLSKRSIQFDHPIAMGAVMHEAFHAKHSTMELLEGLNKEKDAFVRNLATWFEETRIESRAVAALPKNKAFLRACALRLVIGDLKEDTDFQARGIQGFSQLMLLTLARIDAGVLRKKDVKIVQDAADKLFDRKTNKKLQNIWVRAQRHTGDTNAEPLLALAREWVKALEDAGQDPKDGEGEGLPEWLKELMQAMMGEGGEGGESGEGEQDGEGSGAGGLLEAMAGDTETDAQSEANGQAIQEVMDAIAEAKAAAGKEAKTHEEKAAEVFGRGTGPAGHTTSSRLVEERAPSPQERVAAVALSKALERARYRDRVVVKRGSVIPPGRLNARKALAGAEQRSRGVEVTAEAWSRKQRFHTEDPQLTVGVLVDISGSMGGAMQPMASTAWVLSEATRRVQGKCAMVYYGNDVFATLKAGQHLDKVKVYSAPDGTERFNKAFQALDGALHLTTSTGARLLVIVSDLYYTGQEGERTKYWMKRCREAGVAVIVVPFEYEDHAKGVVKSVKANGIEVVPTRMTRDVVGAAKVIGAAAVRQLENVSG